ncbi:MAG: enoyl-CoA hydratase/isomerase family protein [Burkholderiales bacterium]|jgi:enoyl-CoA hydratase/carnithine racemase|nr:enoyl-CoA hydratase/isomerase family protein [Burkholderiales bacterium]
MAGTVSVVWDGGLATVTLTHAGKFNAMSRSMWRSLRKVFEDFQAQSDLRCVVVQGQGAHFCAGGDIAEYPAFRFDVQLLRDFHENDVWGGLQAMLDCDVPVIAQIDGNCMGAGLEIASCCDLRIASEAARFGAPIAKLGFPMAPREAALVMRSVGELTAREMLLSAAVLDAQTMQQRGFLNQVVKDTELAAAVAVCVQRMRPLAPQAARLNKRSFRALAPVLSESIASDLIAHAYHYADSQEHREGVKAFTEKRPPQF